jgi:nucleotide-binding universal stress UspA family protein
MLPIRVILHPTDFSLYSQAALPLACALARDHGATLVLVHVRSIPISTYGELGAVPAEPVDVVKDRMRQLLPPDYTGRVEYEVRTGEAATEVVDLTRQRHADLIVLGTHGRSGVLRLLLGSVAEAVLRKAPCPVLTVKRPPDSADAAPENVRKEAVKPHGSEPSAYMNYDDLVTVSSIGNPAEAELIRSALQGEGIHCVLEGALQAGIVGITGVPIQIQVRAADADRAAKFIRTHEHHGA